MRVPNCLLERSEYVYAPIQTGGPGIYISVNDTVYGRERRGLTHGIVLITLVNVEHDARGVGGVFAREGNEVGATVPGQVLVYALKE